MKTIRSIVPVLRLVSSDGANRRQTGRVHASGVACDRGRLIDLSGTGARLETRLPWREGERREIGLTGSDLRLGLAARCVWRRREGFLRYIVGLAFEDVSEEQARALSLLALTAAQATEQSEAPRLAA